MTNVTSIPQDVTTANDSEHLPWNGLIILALAGFICALTETIPAGLLIEIGNGLKITESLAGQLVTAYALGSLLAAIPLTIATQGWRRKPLLLLCILGFLIFNTITAVSTNYILTLIARFLAGITAGVLWGITAGYARLMVTDALKGKAMAVAMVGTPLALAFGVPLGTYFGSFMGWRFVFILMSLMTLILIFWSIWKLPNFPGQSSEKRLSIVKVWLTPKVRPILLIVLAWVLSHNILYTYIAPYLYQFGLSNQLDIILLTFGAMALISIWIVGLLIDKMLRRLVLLSLSGFGLASLVLGLSLDIAIVIYISVAIWGLTFGGAATLLQTAIANVSGNGSNVAQSMLVTTWNLGIGMGSFVGALLMETIGVLSFPRTIALLLLLAFLIAWSGIEKTQISKN
ncbi:MFS transporter [Metabacillus fastidiosus]|uniref:MFS transporter n=1 Tax=Metabacillus fastidiosus TaxID=1458 RepID=A0ABU6NWA9_9BACI|nr:MFS transporter [Metabacillus fastidiosus]